MPNAAARRGEGVSPPGFVVAAILKILRICIESAAARNFPLRLEFSSEPR